LLLATSGASQQLRSAWKSNNGDETWTTVEDSMDWAGQILQVNDMFYALEVNQRSVFGHLHGTFRSSLSSLAQLRKPRSDQSWGDAALQDTVLEQHFSLGLLGGGFIVSFPMPSCYGSGLRTLVLWGFTFQ